MGGLPGSSDVAGGPLARVAEDKGLDTLMENMPLLGESGAVVCVASLAL